MRGLHFDARQHRGRVLTGDFVNRSDAHQLFGIGLQPIQEAAVA